jgi:hypothetical protein
MTAELVIPLTVRHFHKPSGRLIATVVAAVVGEDRIAVGIARCNKLDRPSRKVGRELAVSRLTRGLGLGDQHPTLTTFDKDKNLFRVMTETEFQKLLADNPFNKWACPFGAYTDDVKALRKKPKKTTKKRK